MVRTFPRRHGKRHKYNAVAAPASALTDGYSFASQLERALYLHIKAREQAGEVELLQVQARVELSRAAVVYIADFKVFDRGLNEIVFEESKGFETPEWRLKRKLWTAYGPNLLRVWKGSGMRIYLAEEIRPKGEG